MARKIESWAKVALGIVLVVATAKILLWAGFKVEWTKPTVTGIGITMVLAMSAYTVMLWAGRLRGEENRGFELLGKQLADFSEEIIALGNRVDITATSKQLKQLAELVDIIKTSGVPLPADQEKAQLDQLRGLRSAVDQLTAVLQGMKATIDAALLPPETAVGEGPFAGRQLLEPRLEAARTGSSATPEPPAEEPKSGRVLSLGGPDIELIDEDAGGAGAPAAVQPRKSRGPRTEPFPPLEKP